MAAMWRCILVVCLLGICLATSSFPPLPTITPTIFDPDAPSTDACPGYLASSIHETEHTLAADLTLAGEPCNVFGNDILDLRIEVSYQAKERLNVRIEPQYISPLNRSRFILGTEFVRLPEWDGQTNKDSSDLVFRWSNEPTFQFSIQRRHDGEELFSTVGRKLVFEDQFLELTTNVVDDYDVYGLAENIRNFRLGTNYTQTLFNADSADALDENAYGTHPFYQETRYHHGRPSTAHGVYARNAHAQEWLMREKTITYRAIGGVIDFHFLSGQTHQLPVGQKTPASSALEVFRQYQRGCVGFPAMQQYWTLGFHQCHWGYNSIADLREVVDNYAAADIPLESIWNDIDIYDQYRIFTNNKVSYPSDGMHEFMNWLHERGQRYVAIQDSNVYFPDPSDATDVESYPAFARGAAVDAFIRDADTGYFFIGQNWPGYSVWADWHNNRAVQWWIDEVERFHDLVPFDGLWVDLNEPQSFCTYSCGNIQLNGTDFQLPGGVIKITNSDPRQLNFPPYQINNAKPTKQIIEQTIALDAFHNDEYQTREYDVHSLWSIGATIATYEALKSIHPGKRPFILTRSTFAGNGQYVAHWGGDNESKWGAMYFSISQSFLFQMAGIPLFGVDTCGFAGNTTEELCARWMELSAFFPFFRNHYADGERPQEAYIWPSVAEASRRVIAVRYTLLPYLYTLFYHAHTRGDTVMRALAWEFPDDPTLRETDNQFLVGPSILVTPVLESGATKVKGVFPGIGQGTRWYDLYTTDQVTGVEPGENVTMSAPLEHINVHVRGGTVLPMQKPGNTTTATRANPWSLLVALDDYGSAAGDLYLDDGESIDPELTKFVDFFFADGELAVRPWGRYPSEAALANITIAGLDTPPREVELRAGAKWCSGLDVWYGNGTLRITNLDRFFEGGAFEEDILLRVR